MALNITVDNVLEAKTSEYLATLPTEEDRVNFINSLKESSGQYIQKKIDEAEALLVGIQTTANNAISCSTTWAAQIAAIAVPDPTAPKAGAAALVSLSNSVSMAKGNLQTSNAQLLQLQEMIEMMGVSMPSIVDTTKSLLDQAISALNSIPI